MVKFSVVNHKELKQLPAPPQVIKSLLNGFEMIANHIIIILFPVLLDIFLWFGPHLSIRALIQGLFEGFSKFPEFTSPEYLQIIQINQEMWSIFTERFNVFVLLRTFPIGVTSLMVSEQPINTPLGAAKLIEIPSFFTLIFIGLFIMVIGVVLGVLYFSAVAQITMQEEKDRTRLLFIFFSNLTQSFLLSIIWLGVLVAISIPAGCLLSVISLSGIGEARMAMFVAMVLFVWLLFPLFLSPHGIFLARKSAWVSVKDSIRITRFTVPSMALLFLAIVLLSEGLNLLWRVAGENSWLTLVGIIGHAFITTGLLAATFFYYRDATHWVDKMLEYIKLKNS